MIPVQIQNWIALSILSKHPELLHVRLAPQKRISQIFVQYVYTRMSLLSPTDSQRSEEKLVLRNYCAFYCCMFLWLLFSNGITCTSPLLKSPPTQSPLQFHRIAIHRLLNSPPSQLHRRQITPPCKSPPRRNLRLATHRRSQECENNAVRSV